MNKQGLMSTPKDGKQQHRGAVGKFDAGGEFGPIEDRNEFECRLDALSPDQKELGQENARFADLCRYFSDKKMDIPPQALDQIGRLARLAIEDRIRVLKAANLTLMEYLNDVGEDPQIRQ
jgi:hypothetical protein